MPIRYRSQEVVVYRLMRDAVRGGALVVLPLALLVLAGCEESATGSDSSCGSAVDLFPIPVDPATSLFDDEIDDGFLAVAFDPDFEFPFYGTSYDVVFLNTNGGMTFVAGEDEYDVSADEVVVPGIGVFWGDLDAAGSTASEMRADQMTYEACADRFVVRYMQLQDHDVDEWNNTATVTLHEDGRIVIAYGTVLSEDILVGVWDGTHSADTYPVLAASYADFDAMGTGVILFDWEGSGPLHTGELTGMTVTFTP